MDSALPPLHHTVNVVSHVYTFRQPFVNESDTLLGFPLNRTCGLACNIRICCVPTDVRA